MDDRLIPNVQHMANVVVRRSQDETAVLKGTEWHSKPSRDRASVRQAAKACNILYLCHKAPEELGERRFEIASRILRRTPGATPAGCFYTR